MIELEAAFRGDFPERTVDAFNAIDGRVFKRIQNRSTRRFERNGRAYFIKSHAGIGWAEIVKNLLALRLPVVDAGGEWRAIHRLLELGLHTMPPVGWGREGLNPATRRSFLITRSVEHTTDLESWAGAHLAGPLPAPRLAAKRVLLDRVARITAMLHDHGVNHRDYYLCHLRLDTDAADPLTAPERVPIYVMDLHRAQLRAATPRRWAVKDVAGLLHSARHGPAALRLSRGDLGRFLRGYLGADWRARLRSDPGFWRDVSARYRRMCQRDNQQPGTLPGALDG